MKQKGIATIVTVIIIAAAFAAGLWFKHYSDEIDSPIEQVAENILDTQGIDVDFSKEKKEKDAA